MVQFRAMDPNLQETQRVLARVVEVLRAHAPDLVVEEPTPLERRGGGGRFVFAVQRIPGRPDSPDSPAGRAGRAWVQAERVDEPGPPAVRALPPARRAVRPRTAR